MGTNGDAPTAKIYGNFKCPVTEGFVFGNLGPIMEEFVVTGRLNLEFHNLTYEPGTTSSYFISDSDPRIAAVGLAVWDEDPDNYWQFYYETFADRPSGYVDYDELASRVRSADVSNADATVDRAEDGQYDAAVEQIAATAATDGVAFTPQLVLAGETAAPHHGTQSILNWIEARIEDAPAETSEQEEPEADDDTEPEAEPEDDPEESPDDVEEDEESDAETEDDQSGGESEDPDTETEEESAGGADERPEDDETEAEDEDSKSESQPDSEELDDEPDEKSAYGSADESTNSEETDGSSDDESTQFLGKMGTEDCPFL
ncbi:MULTISPECIES: DsbA family protein [Natrialbaceae]|uniref:DsbA family protein n=1 Tax=Natrialbaceae TaxID=1644061 RepID=UPI00207C58FB|nr:thioredoxin domain-containing protein [Natronococcus sp. CG52]